MSSAIVNEIQPINYQEQQENIGRSWCKISNEAWFGPGLDIKFMVMLLWEQKIDL